MTKVCIIGAGSTVFASQLMSDILLTPVLDRGTFALVDIDSERLEHAHQMAERLIAITGRRWNVEASTDRREVLEDCDYVINTIEVAGLQNVRFVFLDPENNDVIIAGAAEGWTTDGFGTVVGAKTNAPVLQLEDLLVALRSATREQDTGITCSIDPTSEGLTKLQEFYAQNQRLSEPAMRQMEELLGPQSVTVTGVPPDSHFARVMVAADFVMKRIAMGLEKSP